MITSPAYVPALTGLRAYAFGLVLLDHWVGGPLRSLLLGSAGVSLFFVLSGFLISRILLTARQQRRPALTTGSSAIKTYLLRFYVRRSIRIFPVYFLTLIVLLLAGDGFVRGHSGWFFTYVANLLFVAAPETYPIHLGHLWSLSAEEQLYLVLPLLIWITPTRLVPLLAVGLIAAGLIFRAGCFWAGVAHPWEMAYCYAPGCLDSYGIGLALAYYWSDQWAGSHTTAGQLARTRFFQSGVLWFVLSSGWPLVILFAQLRTIMGHGVYSGIGLSVMSRLSVSLLGGYLIGYLLVVSTRPPLLSSVQRASVPVGRYLLENRLVIYLGQISYGLYLFHSLLYNHLTPAEYPTRQFFLRIATCCWPAGSLPSSGSGPALIFYGVLLTVLASASWFWLEKPLLTRFGRTAQPGPLPDKQKRERFAVESTVPTR